MCQKRVSVCTSTLRLFLIGFMLRFIGVGLLISAYEEIDLCSYETLSQKIHHSPEAARDPGEIQRNNTFTVPDRWICRL